MNAVNLLETCERLHILTLGDPEAPGGPLVLDLDTSEGKEEFLMRFDGEQYLIGGTADQFEIYILDDGKATPYLRELPYSVSVGNEGPWSEFKYFGSMESALQWAAAGVLACESIMDLASVTLMFRDNRFQFIDAENPRAWEILDESTLSLLISRAVSWLCEQTVQVRWTGGSLTINEFEYPVESLDLDKLVDLYRHIVWLSRQVKKKVLVRARNSGIEETGAKLAAILNRTSSFYSWVS